MAGRRGTQRGWTSLRCLASSLVVARTLALTVVEQNDGFSGAVDVAMPEEFRLCSTPPATCRRDNPYFDIPSESAMMTSLIHALHWFTGRTSREWLAACFLTTHYSLRPSMPCRCTPHLGPWSLNDVFWGAWVMLWSYQIEAHVFMRYLYGDIFRRTQVLDSILASEMRSRHFDQVLMLGSGFDTRAYRIGTGLRRVRKVFYTDLPETLAMKEALLEKCEVEPLGGPGQVVNLPLDLHEAGRGGEGKEGETFPSLWRRPDFVGNGSTLVVGEQVFGALHLASNVRWLQRLRAAALAAEGQATLVLMATRGPRFEKLLFPKCLSESECLRSQMPTDPAKAEAFMRRLGWERDRSHPDLERSYLEEKIDKTSFGYVGVFRTVGAGPAAA